MIGAKVVVDIHFKLLMFVVFGHTDISGTGKLYCKGNMATRILPTQQNTGVSFKSFYPHCGHTEAWGGGGVVPFSRAYTLTRQREAGIADTARKKGPPPPGAVP